MKTQMKDIKNLEEILVKTVPEIFVYFIVAFLIGNLLEALMPDVKSQGKLALSFEVFTQIFVLIFVFIILSDLYRSKIGLIVFVITTVGVCTNLLKKLDRLGKKTFNRISSSNSCENYEDDVQIYDTKIDKDSKKRYPPVDKHKEDLEENDEEEYEEYEDEEEEEIEEIGATSIRNLKF